jgi:predicted transcriptional regulator
MSDKPRKPGLEESEAQYKPEDDDAVEFTDAYLDAWFERNAEALNASLDEAEAQIERGEWYTLEEVMARVRAEIKLVAKKA